MGQVAKTARFRTSWLAFDDIDLDWLDVDALLFQPLDRGFDLSASTFQFQANDADFIRHTALANIRHERKFVAQFPNYRCLNQLGRIH